MTSRTSQNELLTNVLKTTFVIRDQITELARALVPRRTSRSSAPMLPRRITEQPRRSLVKNREDTRRKVLNSMMQLQVAVNSIIDASKNPMPLRQGQLPPPGVKQGLEKKEGLFRKHMMGKRVNFAARSVISPDVNIETTRDRCSARLCPQAHLPEPVTVHNVQLMRQLVINGPFKYPGAVAIRSEDGPRLSSTSTA